MNDYTMALREHRDNLTLQSSRLFREAMFQAKHHQGSFESAQASATWHANMAAEAVAEFYFYDSYTNIKR